MSIRRAAFNLFVIAALFISNNSLAAEAPGDLSDALTLYAKLDYAGALRLLRPLADHGDPVAQEVLGFIYSRGEGVPRDDGAAFGWFKRAANAGRPEPQFELGKMYRDGVGVTADSYAALFWFRCAAAQGKADAFDAIADLYEGRGDIPPEPATALKWLLRAADHGSAHAMYLIGLRYAQTQEGTRDEIEALKWLNLAYTEAIGSLREDVSRLRTTIAEHLMPMQVQIALTRSQVWRNAHHQD